MFMFACIYRLVRMIRSTKLSNELRKAFVPCLSSAIIVASACLVVSRCLSFPHFGRQSYSMSTTTTHMVSLVTVYWKHVLVDAILCGLKCDLSVKTLISPRGSSTPPIKMYLRQICRKDSRTPTFLGMSCCRRVPLSRSGIKGSSASWLSHRMKATSPPPHKQRSFRFCDYVAASGVNVSEFLTCSALDLSQTWMNENNSRLLGERRTLSCNLHHRGLADSLLDCKYEMEHADVCNISTMVFCQLCHPDRSVGWQIISGVWCFICRDEHLATYCPVITHNNRQERV